MTAQERYVPQSQLSGLVPRGRDEASSKELEGNGQSDQTIALRAIAQSVGNNAMGKMLANNDAGMPLETGFREQMEQRLGTSLGHVRVRDDASAHASAADLNSTAYTAGENIVLGTDAPSIQEVGGKDLLAHELVHVVQQRNAAAVVPGVSGQHDSLEREADSASKQALMGRAVRVGGSGSVPGVQRQPAGSITKRVESPAASRDEVQQAILEFLQKAQTAQKSDHLTVTDAVKTALRTLATVDSPGASGGVDSGKAMRLTHMDTLLNSATTDAVDLAQKVAQILPEPFNREALKKLKTAAVLDAEKSTPERVKDLAEKSFSKPKTEPSSVPQPDPSKRLQDEEAKAIASRGLKQPSGLGPVSVDVLSVFRFLKGLPTAIKPKPQKSPTQAPTKSHPEVYKAIQTIPPDALIPAEARGKDEAGNFADAHALADELVAKLEAAEGHAESVDLHLPDDYNHVKDRAAMVQAVRKLVETVRQASGSTVKYVDVYFGGQLVTRSVGNPSP